MKRYIVFILMFLICTAVIVIGRLVIQPDVVKFEARKAHFYQLLAEKKFQDARKETELVDPKNPDLFQIKGQIDILKQPGFILGSMGVFSVLVVNPLLLLVILLILWRLQAHYPQCREPFVGFRLHLTEIIIALSCYLVPILLAVTFCSIIGIKKSGLLIICTVQVLDSIAILPAAVLVLQRRSIKRVKAAGESEAGPETPVILFNWLEQYKWFLFGLWPTWLVISYIGIKAVYQFL